MKDLKRPNGPKTPGIDFKPKSGLFLISGISVPEDTRDFYGPIITWTKEYIKSPAEVTNIEFKLSYVNTSSLQYIYDFLMVLDELNKNTSSVNVDWYYLDEDIDMQEMGEDFRDAVGLNFTFHEVENVL